MDVVPFSQPYGSQPNPVATQPLTQPVLESRRSGEHTGLSREDEEDVICILCPTSVEACKLARMVAETSPQHILQRPIGSTYADTQATQAIGAGPVTNFYLDYTALHPEASGFDIALRMSSKLKDPSLGFVFGRNSQKSDIVLRTDLKPFRLSNMHFRISLTEDGILMLKDMSTNGTFVDKQLLRHADPNLSAPRSRMLQQGSLIEVIGQGIDEHIRFVVSIPSRDRGMDAYAQNMVEYIAYVQQVTRQAEAVKKAKKEGREINVPEIPLNPLKYGRLKRQSNPQRDEQSTSLAAGTVRYNSGMHWNGGNTYNVIELIGKGAFAIVYLCGRRDTGQLVAIKEIEKRSLIKNGTLDVKIDNELRIMKSLSHPHIVEYIDHHDMAKFLYIIMEYVSGGQLLTYINTIGAMPEHHCQSVTRQMCHALKYLHGSGITHRDIKPDNILIAKQNPFTVKLSDFGLSKMVKDETTFLKTFCGTLLYCAPEVYPDYERFKQGLPRKRRRANEAVTKTSPYSSAVDVWSLGAVLFHLLCTKPPYMGKSEDRGISMLEAIMHHDLPINLLVDAGTSTVGMQFISSLLRIDPTIRPTVAELLDDPWIVNVDDVEDMNLVMEPTQVGLDNIEEEEDLDASQLSLNDRSDVKLPHWDSDEEDNVETDEAGHLRRSKRTKTHFAFGHVNGNGMGNIASSGALGRPEENRLFGEIRESALQDEGALGADVRDALRLPDPILRSRLDTGRHIDSFLASCGGGQPSLDSWDSGYEAPQTKVPHLLHSTDSAASLYGAEAQIGLLNMASLDSPASSAIHTDPTSPKSRQLSPVSTGSKRGSQAEYSGDEDTTTTTPKRQRRARIAETLGEDLPKASVRDRRVKLKSSRARDADSRNKAKRRVDAVSNEPSSSISSLPSTKSNMGDSKSDPRPEEPSQLPSTSAIAADSVRYPDLPPIADDSKDKATSTELIQTRTNTSQDQDGFAKPLPRLGLLTTIPGSCLTKAIKLQRRFTMFGRSPQNNEIHPDPNDSRVGRFAFDILFWRPGIEEDIAAGMDWLTITDCWAIISTRCNQYITVNGVKLTKGDGSGLLYGKLYHGDIVGIYDNDKHGFIRFKTEIYHGLSAHPRKPADWPFLVEVEVEKFLQAELRQQGATTSQG